MDIKALLLQEIKQAPDLLLEEVLDFLRYLKAKYEQEKLEHQIALEVACAALKKLEKREQYLYK